jgi:hypothetical protein
MSHEQAAWNPDWDQYIKNLNSYIKGLGESTGRFGGEESLRCHTCGTWVETTLAQFSPYDGEPLCADCALAEGTDE